MFFIKKLKACFRQGEHAQRRELLKTITKVIADEYTEDNYYTRLYWLVEEIMLSDPEFGNCLDDVSIDCIKRGLATAVDTAKRQRE